MVPLHPVSHHGLPASPSVIILTVQFEPPSVHSCIIPVVKIVKQKNNNKIVPVLHCVQTENTHLYFLHNS